MELHKLGKLKEFSLEWFIYLSPPIPKIMRDSKGLLVIERVKSFCKNFTVPHTSHSQALQIEQRSFGDFIIHFHQIKASEINSLTFGVKKRALLHQLCINGHSHLMRDLVSPPLSSLTSSPLISNSLDLNIQDKEGTTPLCFAFR